VKRYLGSVVPQGDNFFAALNSAVFSDGSFVYVPKGVRCPMELSTYFSHIGRSIDKIISMNRHTLRLLGSYKERAESTGMARNFFGRFVTGH